MVTTEYACPSCRGVCPAGTGTCSDCGQSVFAIAKGAVLDDRYEILEALGRGGMGMVYKAHDRELDETVAVKVLRPEIALAGDLALRFRNEVRLARRVRHRNVCAIHEYGQHGPLRFIVMEYVGGVDFKHVLREHGPLPAPEAVAVVAQVAAALQAIHEAGIVHRDLKTPNIMRDQKGVVRLMDFGIAKQFDGETSPGATATGLAVGTPEYMSPEQARAEKVDQRTDVYALGVVCYELLTGVVPFRGDTPLATLLMHLQDPPPVDETTVPPPFVAVLRRALAKDREERFESAPAFAEALRDAWTAGAVRPPRVAAPATPTRKSRVPAAVGLAVTAGALAAWLAGRRGEVGPVATPPPTVHERVALPAPPTAPPMSPEPALPSAAPTREPAPVAPPPSPAPSPRRAAASPVPPSPRAPDPRPPVTVAPEPAVRPPATPGPSLAPAPPLPAATLRFRITPWAEVSVDGRSYGRAQSVAVPPGTHVVVFVHPGYEPLRRAFVLSPGETRAVAVDMRDEAIRRRQ